MRTREMIDVLATAQEQLALLFNSPRREQDARLAATFIFTLFKQQAEGTFEDAKGDTAQRRLDRLDAAR